MSFNSIPLPRQFDCTIMSFVLFFKPSAQTLCSINKCRIFKRSLFLSDLVTADGRRLEEFCWNKGSVGASTYTFPKELPTCSDWECWMNFWRQVTDNNGTLKSPLGKWVHPSHRQWQWFYGHGHIFQREGPSLRSVTLDSVHTVHRTNDNNSLIPLEATSSLEVVSLVSRRTGMRVQSIIRIPPLLSSESTIWNILSSYGGEWMWGQVENDLQDTHRVNILLSCLLNKSLVCVSDGSFNPKNPDICGIG